ncbi:hypothetical protein QQF64_008855, partial [Cirrhinus molitorella]
MAENPAAFGSRPHRLMVIPLSQQFPTLFKAPALETRRDTEESPVLLQVLFVLKGAGSGHAQTSTPSLRTGIQLFAWFLTRMNGTVDICNHCRNMMREKEKGIKMSRLISTGPSSFIPENE